MSLTDLFMGLDTKVHIAKKKVKQSEQEPVDRKESVLKYLDGQIKDLEEKGNLDPEYHKVKQGDRKGAKIRKITAWSAVDDEGKREIIIMCKNKKMYINETAAIKDTGIFIDAKDDSYEKVLKTLKDIRKGISDMSLEDFNPWTRNKKTKVVSRID